MSQGVNESMVSDLMKERSTALPPDSSHLMHSMPHPPGSETMSMEVNSILSSHQLPDPLAGNNVLQSLGRHLKQGALEQINERIKEESINYEIARRKRDLAGQEWLEKPKGAYAPDGAL